MATAGRLRYLEAPARHAADPGRQRAAGTLVLLHAFPLNARMWESQLALADQGWRVIAPQLRGFDGGDAGPPAASVDDYAGDLVDLLDRLHVDHAVIGGLSMGGYVAFALVRHALRYVRGLILADTRPQADTAEAKQNREKMLALVRDKGPAAVAEEMLPKLLGESTRRDRPDVVERTRALMLASSSEAIGGAIRAILTRPDSTPLLDTIRVPTLIIVGEEDVVTPRVLSEGMHRAIAGSQLVTIPKAGHLPNLERPHAFNLAVAGFLANRV